MITEKDLQEAIAECVGQRNPNASTCIKLAAFYTIRNELFGGGHTDDPVPVTGYSGANIPDAYESDSEFGQAIRGQDITGKVLPLIDDLLDALSVLNPRLYNSFIEKLIQ